MEEQGTTTANPLSEIVAANGGTIPTPQEVAAQEAERRRFDEAVRAVDDVGEYKSEADDPNVLVYGPWLERGGSAFWVSTSGTGKSTSCMQFVHCAAAGVPFCGLKPHGKLKFWVFQSEDSPRRVAQDRIDVRTELKEQYPDFDWDKIGREGVKFVKLDGAVGVKFLDELDRLLETAKRRSCMPDVIVLNPLLAYVGGPISDGSYVTPFLRGGEISGKETKGLQSLLERHKVGVLIYHHTPKPPTDKEIDAWMKSAFPEYQGAGSSDITNWGRSFLTMMRVKGRGDMVCVTAGKNGAELGWERVGDAFRHYLAYSGKTGVSGKARHAWRELTLDEYDEVVNKAKNEHEKKIEDDVGKIAEEVKRKAMSKTEIYKFFANKIPRVKLRAAVDILYTTPMKYGLTVKSVLRGRGWTQYIGQAEGLREAAADGETEQKYNETMEARREAEAPKTAENGANVEPLGAIDAPADAQLPTENAQEDEDGWF